jgi:Uncharacterized conserved protein
MTAILIYVAAIAAANLVSTAFGPWASPISAFFLIGLDLALRDELHDRWQGSMLWPRMVGLITVAGAVSFAINPAAGRIAVASVVAFCAAGLVDAAVYHWLRDRPYLQKSNGSNVAGAAVDSVLFPVIAFGAWIPVIMALQFAAKVGGGALWSLLFSNLPQKKLPQSN